jgi:Ca2+-binding EF-hand superfamily protein
LKGVLVIEAFNNIKEKNMIKANKNLMTISILGAISATLLLTTMDSQAKGNREGRDNMTTGLFNRMDVDGNGVLSLDELTVPALSKAENIFTRKDTDADGFLTFEEMTGGKERVDLSAIADELVQCVADIKEASGNENIIVPDPSIFLSGEDKFANTDTSGDSVLELAEVLAMATNKASSKFSHMDTNASNDVTQEEFTTYKQQHHSTRRAIKSCIDEVSEDDIF